MKINFLEDKIIVYLRKSTNDEFDILNEKKLEQYFKELFLKLKNYYDIDMNGYYMIDVYLDHYYGMILEIESSDLDYYNYFSQIDMKINVLKNSSFLYELDYDLIDSKITSLGKCYKFNNKIYLEINKNIDDICFGKLLEYSEIIYGEKKEKIVKRGKKVEL